jgi:hypothetical protein
MAMSASSAQAFFPGTEERISTRMLEQGTQTLKRANAVPCSRPYPWLMSPVNFNSSTQGHCASLKTASARGFTPRARRGSSCVECVPPVSQAPRHGLAAGTGAGSRRLFAASQCRRGAGGTCLPNSASSGWERSRGCMWGCLLLGSPVGQ